jgi:hypothetical protein
MRRAFILIAAVALLTAACKIETNFDATLNADGSGTVSAEIGLDEEALAFLQGEDPFEDAPADATTRTEERGDMTFYIVTQDFASADELASLATDDDGLFETFTATFSDTRVTVRGTTADAGGGLMGEDLGDFDPQLLEDSFSANIRITMPGKVIESNADIVDGSSLTWEVPLFAGGSVEITAQSDPTQSGDGGFPIWAIVAIVAVAVAALAAVVWWLRQRSSTEPPAAEAADAAPPRPPGGPSEETPEHGDESPPPPAP